MARFSGIVLEDVCAVIANFGQAELQAVANMFSEKAVGQKAALSSNWVFQIPHSRLPPCMYRDN